MSQNSIGSGGLLRAHRRAATPPRRRAWLRIFVVRCGLPCDPPGGGHSCNGSTLPRFDRTVCDYFTPGCGAKNLRSTIEHGRPCLPYFPRSRLPPTYCAGRHRAICIAFGLAVWCRVVDGETDITRVWPAIRRRALRKGLKPQRAFVAGLTIGLFLCVTQLAANALGQHCPVGQIFCFEKCSILLTTRPIAGDAGYRAKLAKCVRTAHARSEERV